MAAERRRSSPGWRNAGAGNIDVLFQGLGSRIGDGLKELTVTTNGTQLAKYATQLVDAGVRRINVSLDTLDPAGFTVMTRWGRIEPVLEGIFAAKAAGLAIKINAVAMKGVNEDEFDRLLAWCGEHGFDLCLIETMPMGEISEDRTDPVSPTVVGGAGAAEAALDADRDGYRTGGPARYFDVAETGRRARVPFA